MSYSRPSRFVHTVEPVEHGVVPQDTVGNLDHEIERLRRFKKNGLSEIALRIYENPEWTIRLVGERVLPAL